MYNPSYLIKSRHDVYYFRYPLPAWIIGDCKPSKGRISISLQTRCPKEALRLAKILEYHSHDILNRLDNKHMDFVDIVELLKGHWGAVLEQTKARINRDGALPQANVQNFERMLEDLDSMIAANVDYELELIDLEWSYEDYAAERKALDKIMQGAQVSFPEGSREYNILKSQNKFVRKEYVQEVLRYNDGFVSYALPATPKAMMREILAVSEQKHPTMLQAKAGKVKPVHTLGAVMQAYLEEIKPSISARSFEEQRDCLAYLTDWLGQDYPIIQLDVSKAREAKGLLAGTPKNRNKQAVTKGRTIPDQIALAAEHALPCLGNASVNKYLTYFDGMLGWAKDNRYITDNPFTGIRVKAAKKKTVRRDAFSKVEVQKILSGLGQGAESSLVKNESNYWGALIAVYTGARRNEIAGLLPEDVKYDDASGIWYFDITEEGEQGKSLKSDAAKRIVPIHSRLLELGFMDFLEKSKAKGTKIRHGGGHKVRLLYDLTYTEHEQWGRNLGRWFNERFLAKLGLKTSKKTLHSLRHSFITSLSAAGVDGAIVKSIVGHEADTVTTQVYTHYGVDHLPVFKEAMEKLPY